MEYMYKYAIFITVHVTPRLLAMNKAGFFIEFGERARRGEKRPQNKIGDVCFFMWCAIITVPSALLFTLDLVSSLSFEV
jgi:hypothetical protein